MRDWTALGAVNARPLLLTILGELVWPSGRPAWTSSLVEVLDGLGVEEHAARQVIARAGRGGWILSERRGRTVRWSLTPKLVRVFEEGVRRVASMSDPFAEWDGRWLTVLFTIPHRLRGVRKQLYTGLNWAGFGNPVPGVWLSPHLEREEEVSRLVEELGLADLTMSVVGTAGGAGLSVAEIVGRGWDLDAVARRYECVLQTVEQLQVAAQDQLFAHIRLVSELQSFPLHDPQLPEALLPDWVGRRTARAVERLRAEWSGPVRARWAELDSAPL